MRVGGRAQGGVRLVGVVVAGRGPGRRAIAASRRAAALSPIARIAAGGGPTQRIPAALDAPRRSRRSRRGTRSPGGARRRRRAAPPRRRRRRRAGRARPAPSVARDDRPDPEAVAGSRDPSGDLAAVGDEERSGSARARPAVRSPARARTRQTRQTRHASAHRRVARAASRRRSSAGRSAWTSRAALRDLARTQFLGHVVSRSSHIAAADVDRRRRPSVSPRSRWRPGRPALLVEGARSPPAPPR